MTGLVSSCLALDVERSHAPTHQVDEGRVGFARLRLAPDAAVHDEELAVDDADLRQDALVAARRADGVVELVELHPAVAGHGALREQLRAVRAVLRDREAGIRPAWRWCSLVPPAIVLWPTL